MRGKNFSLLICICFVFLICDLVPRFDVDVGGRRSKNQTPLSKECINIKLTHSYWDSCVFMFPYLMFLCAMMSGFSVLQLRFCILEASYLTKGGDTCLTSSSLSSPTQLPLILPAWVFVSGFPLLLLS